MSAFPLQLPQYEPVPYSFAGLEFSELPDDVKEYLFDEFKLTGKNLTAPKDFVRRKHLLVDRFRDDILRSNSAFLSVKQEAIRETDEAGWMSEESIQAGDGRRMRVVLEMLIPERGLVLDDFVRKADALIWLEMHVTGQSRMLSVKEQQEFRDKWLLRIVEETQAPVVDVDEMRTGRKDRSRRDIPSSPTQRKRQRIAFNTSPALRSFAGRSASPRQSSL